VDKFTLRKRLPPCQVSRKLVSQVENFLNVQIPKLFQKELASMSGIFQGQNAGNLRKYAIYLQQGTQTVELKKLEDLKGAVFSNKVQGLSLHLRLGIPEIISISISFPRNRLSEVDLTVTDAKAKLKAQKIYEALSQILASYTRKRAIVHNRVFQVLLTLAVPLTLIGLGAWRQSDLFTLFLSLGWLVLLAVFLNVSLAHTFPYTTFQTDRRFSLRSVLYALALLLACVLTAGYTYLLVLQMPELSGMIPWLQP